jgi:hypothetical protein
MTRQVRGMQDGSRLSRYSRPDALISKLVSRHIAGQHHDNWRLMLAGGILGCLVSSQAGCAGLSPLVRRKSVLDRNRDSQYRSDGFCRYFLLARPKAAVVDGNVCGRLRIGDRRRRGLASGVGFGNFRDISDSVLIPTRDVTTCADKSQECTPFFTKLHSWTGRPSIDMDW